MSDNLLVEAYDRLKEENKELIEKVNNLRTKVITKFVLVPGLPIVGFIGLIIFIGIILHGIVVKPEQCTPSFEIRTQHDSKYECSPGATISYIEIVPFSEADYIKREDSKKDMFAVSCSCDTE